MIKIASVITVYKRLKLLEDNIKSIVNAVDRIVLWRNSNEDLSYIKAISDKIILMGTGENLLISCPLNKVLEWCSNNSYDYLLTMDQDSVWCDCCGFIEAVKRNKHTDVAIYAPNINGEIKTDVDIMDTDYVITSGSLISVPIAREVGGFNEKYGIYWVDGEFAFKIRNAGYRIVKLTRFILKHKLGNPTKTIFGFTTSNYSSFIYFILFRNMLWEHRQYGNKAVSLRCIAYNYVYNIRGIVFGEHNKIKKLLAILRGTFCGLFKSYK